MRISDWSSDVCSSDLLVGNPPFEMDVIEGFLDRAHQILPDDGLVAMVLPAYAFQTPSRVSKWMDRFAIDVNMIPRTLFPGLSKPLVWAKYTTRSEEQTSEIQSLMRNSYAVFCLKKKK